MKRYDMSVVAGTYKVQGEEKRRYENVGEVHENQTGGLYCRMRLFTLIGICMAAIARGDDQLMVNFYEPRGQNKGDDRGNKGSKTDDFDDDIAF